METGHDMETGTSSGLTQSSAIPGTPGTSLSSSTVDGSASTTPSSSSTIDGSAHAATSSSSYTVDGSASVSGTSSSSGSTADGSAASVSADLMSLQLAVILPEEIPSSVLNAADVMETMLEKAIENKIDLYLKEGQRKKFKLLDFTFPKSYAANLKNDSYLTKSIISKICRKVETVEHLILPELGVTTMQKILCEKEILHGITECKRVDVPFSTSGPNTVPLDQSEPYLIQIAQILVGKFAPKPHYCTHIDFKPDEASSKSVDSTTVCSTLKKKLKTAMAETMPKKSKANCSMQITWNGNSIYKLVDKQKVPSNKQKVAGSDKPQVANSRKRHTLGGQPGDTSDTRSMKKSKTNLQVTENSIQPNLPMLETSPLTKFTFDSFQESSKGASNQSISASPPHRSSRWFTAYNYWQLGKIHDRGIKGQNTVIAIVDSGIDPSHLAFRDAGKIVYFQDFSGDKTNVDPNASMDHGTLCAGIACGTEFTCYHDATLKFPAGVAPEAKLVICKVFKSDGSDSTFSAISDALEWILKFNETAQASSSDRIDVVSLSLGSLQFSMEIAKAVANLVNNGIIVVCAASNHGYRFSQPISWPARLGNVLCIGSHGPHGKPSPFSPVGQEIDFLAPGENIIGPSSIPYSSYLTTDSGTSFATPAVAGLVCLILSYIKKNHAEDATYFQNHWVMKEILRGISTSPGRHSDDQGFGALNPLQFFQHPHVLNSIVSILHDQ